jgi:SAM-dependent methyltransferase
MEAFVVAARAALPGVSVEQGGAEQLPYPDASFDVVAAQLVVQFMDDPVAGLAEMARVARPGATVAATVWDHSQDRGPLSLFWRAARDVDPEAPGEGHQAGVAEGELAALFERAGMPGASTTVLSVPVVHPTFEEWWAPYTLGVGPAGGYVAQLDEPAREVLRARCEALLPAAPFTIDAVAWTVCCRLPGPRV